MSPLTADQMVAALQSQGVAYTEHPGWRSRGLARAAGRGWDPAGITIHHTGGNLGSRTVDSYIRDIILGDPACPDKAHAVIDPAGVLYLTVAGRANHHLLYSTEGARMVREGRMPLSGTLDVRGTIQGWNRYAYGVEIIAAGAPNAAQTRTAAKWAAAICRAHNWTAGHVAGHGELAADRSSIDPGLDMGAFRTEVAALLNRTNAPAPAPAAATNNPEDSPMATFLHVTPTPDAPASEVSIRVLYQGRLLHLENETELAVFQRVTGAADGDTILQVEADIFATIVGR